MWTYRECMPYHLAIHKIVADVALHQSPGRYEFHAQQAIHRSAVSTRQKWFNFTVSRSGAHVLLSIPEKHDKASEGDRSVSGLQLGHQLPSLSSAIRAWGIRPGFR